MKKRMRRLKPLLMLREREKGNRGAAVRRQTVTRKRKLRRVRLALRKAVMVVCLFLL
jgi:hypothetical protein